jgi:hypothetical protein
MSQRLAFAIWDEEKRLLQAPSCNPRPAYPLETASETSTGQRNIGKFIRSSRTLVDSSWPNAESWEKLRQDVGGNLVKVESPLAGCESAPDSASCQEVIKNLRNPYFIGDQAGGTQTSGWGGRVDPDAQRVRSCGPKGR